MKLPIRSRWLLAFPLVIGLSLSASGAVLTTYDFEGGGADGTGLEGWNVVSTGIGNDLVFTPAGLNPPTGAQPVIPTNFDSASVQGQWAIRTWDNQITGTTSDGNTGAIRTDPFTLPPSAVVDFLIGGGNHEWVGDPDALVAGPACFNLEREVAPGDWEMIATATGPNANTLAPDQFTEAELQPYVGDTVRFAIYDLTTGGWGHIDIDNIVLSGASSDLFDPTDGDGDGIGDNWENFYFGDLTTSDGSQDADGDGLDDLGEWNATTNPKIADSDSDGLSDGDEVNTYGTDPLEPDSDSDGFTDAFEVANVALGFDPLADNSGDDPDGDGLINSEELLHGTNAALADTDSDGINDGDELSGALNPYVFNVLGAVPGDPTLPLEPDSDGDGISDGDEVGSSNGFVTDPNSGDTDGDFMLDGFEVASGLDPTDSNGDNGTTGDPDGDGLLNIDEEFAGTDPNNPDSDGDGLNDLVEDNFGSWGDATATGTDPNNPDSDGDGLPDNVENFDLPYDPANPTTQPGTDPNSADTDFDGWPDGAEISAGTDPTDPLDNPSLPLQMAWDFESGDLTGWTVIDTVHGDNNVFQGTSQPADTGSVSAFDTFTVQGTYYVRTWDGTNDLIYVETDGPTGIIESEEFVLGEQARFDFLIGGGNHPFTGDPDTPDANITALTLERKVAENDWEAIFSATGPNANALAPASWTADQHAGETVRLRIYDTHSGGWGHVDVDDIRYSAAGGTGSDTIEITDVSYDETNDEITITWKSIDGVTYAVDSSTDLVLWPELIDVWPGQPGETSYTHTNPQGPTRFYRVRIPPPAP